MKRIIFACVAAWAAAGTAQAAPSDEAVAKPGGEPPGHSAGDLAKAVQNPVADLISVPFQNNTDYDIGRYDRARNTLNIQPVIPIKISEGWNLITRTIVPIVYQPNVDSGSGGTSGLGDVNPTFFFSPAKPGKLIWGIGPAFVLPTATQTTTGSGKWSVGPSAVLLVQPGHWTIGALANNVWSVAGLGGRPDVNQLLVQYFVNYNLPKAWYLTSSPILTANWESSSGDEWLVPFGGGVGKIFKLGRLPLNAQLSGYYNAVRPDDGTSPVWQLRAQVAMLFPK